MIKEPIFFDRNRVGRVYKGGMLFSQFFGDEAVDGYLPEEWIASNVKAINKESFSLKEGVSRIKDSDKYFDELLKEYPLEMLGRNNNYRILVKVLDSAIRLPAQAHPDKEFSKKYFNSNFGKTECWIILATRSNAKIFFGFKDGVTLEDFEKAIDDSEFDKDAMERLMLEITPQVNDVYFVPAKTVHAIGEGCLILEVQEPTDFTIQPEYFCGEYKLSEQEMYIGLTRKEALKCFKFGAAPNAKLTPKIVEDLKDYTKESLVNAQNTDCFVINRITLKNGSYIANIDNSYAVYIVLDGNAIIKGENYCKKVQKGDYFFMPSYLMGKFTLSGNAKLIECY